MRTVSAWNPPIGRVPYAFSFATRYVVERAAQSRDMSRMLVLLTIILAVGMWMLHSANEANVETTSTGGANGGMSPAAAFKASTTVDTGLK